MPPIRVLVVDDSVVYRRMVSQVLEEDPAIEVVGVAANGRIALQKLTQVNPDLVTLDVEMPVLDGLQTLAELRKTHPDLPVVMFSSLTDRGARATLDALSLGASDYASKPTSAGGPKQGKAQIRAELLPKVRALCPRGPSGAGFRPTGSQFRPAVPRRTGASRRERRIDLVVIGVSTGGPNALMEVIPSLPADFPVPILITQHMPPVFTRSLAERLSQKSGIDVNEGVQDGPIRPGHAWLAPGDFHMIVGGTAGDRRIQLNQKPPENSCRPAVDPMIDSAVSAYGRNILAVILTGMGKDGLRGCQRVHEVGGEIIVQDEATSVVWGMPGFVARAGLADDVLPLSHIAATITRRVSRGRSPNRGAVSGSAL